MRYEDQPGSPQSFRFEASGPFGILTFDTPDSKVNLLGRAALRELDRFGDWLPKSGLHGLIVTSGKETGFSAGADLKEIQRLAPRNGVFASSSTLREHFALFTRAFRKLETSGVPFAAVIDGAAIGGGFELALAAHARFATDRPETRFSLPEFRVGLFPAGGGSQRLPRLIGVQAAMPILTAEKDLSAREAAEIGLATLCASPQHARDAAFAWLSSRPDARQDWDLQPPAVSGDQMPAISQEGPAAEALSRCLTEGLCADMDTGNRIELDALLSLLSRPEPWATLRLRFQGRQRLQAARRAKATRRLELVRDAVADLGIQKWDAEGLRMAADAADRAATDLTPDERAAADAMMLEELAIPEGTGGLLARGEGLWPKWLDGEEKMFDSES